jgi:hypothetical protein
MLSLCFLKKERNRKKRPPQPCQPKKKITQDSLFLVDFEPTMMKKKNSSPPLSFAMMIFDTFSFQRKITA